MSTTPCVQCGEPVAEGIRFCPNCGTRQPDPAAGAATELFNPNQAPQQGGNPVPPTVVIPPSPSTPPQGYNAASGQPQTPPQGYNAGQPQTPPQGYNVPPAGGQGGYPPPPQNPYGNMYPGEEPKKRNWLPWILGIGGVLALCIIIPIVVIGFLTMLGSQVSQVFSTVNSGLEAPVAVATTRPTSTPRPTRERATPTVASEEDDLAQVETAVAAVEATMAAELTALPIDPSEDPTEPTEPTEEVYVPDIAELTAGSSLVFRDEFVDNRNNWFLGRFNDEETNIIENGIFRVIRDVSGRSFELYQVRPLTNFVAEVDCLVVEDKEGGCGIVYGQNDNVGRWDFDIYTDYFQLNLIETEGATRLLEGDPTGIVKPNDWNRVTIVRRDGLTFFYVNGTYLGMVDNPTFERGYVGVLTTSYQDEGAGAVEIQFDNFVVSEFK